MFFPFKALRISTNFGPDPAQILIKTRSPPGFASDLGNFISLVPD